MTRPFAHPMRIFVTGLLAALPLVATIAVFWWLAEFLWRWIGPQSGIGGVFVSFGLQVTGSAWLGYLLGIALLAGLLFLLGLLVRSRLRRGLSLTVTAIMGRIPLVRNVYELAQKMVGLFAQGDVGGTKSMSPVWCHFGGPATDGVARSAVLALLSTTEPVFIDGHPYLGVIVPTAPVPIGGALLFLPQAWVRPAHIGMEALTSIYVSMGLTAAQHLGVAATAATAGAAEVAR